MNKKRCTSVDRQSSVPRRPTLVEAFRAFLAERYPGADFNIAYVGYFESEEAFAAYLIEQTGTPEDICRHRTYTERAREYIDNDYWQFHGHWFCRY